MLWCRGVRSPYFFLDISKKIKLYTNITKAMIHKTFEYFQGRDVAFSINLTIEDILSSEIRTYIYSMLEKYNNGSQVIFEIVESESIQNFKEIVRFIEDVKKYNCRIAIDDFGTGYSNFEYLMQLEAAFIKIDGSIIKNLDKDLKAYMVVSVIVDFAKRVGIKTIAEFVENEAIWTKVKELGIDYSQGYYFSEPMSEI
jgi:EAL domain-containing protein (putative c-di-GMP-specific phosphodiesterase class I)